MSRFLSRPRFGLYLLGMVAGVLSLGSNCSITGIPGLPVVDEIVTIELVNTTNFEVDPLLFVHPDETAPVNVAAQPEWEFVLDPPLAPGEIAEIDFECFDIGTVVSDRALLLTPGTPVASDNAPVVRWGLDYDCGDFVSFIFVDDPASVFFTRVEVNGVFVTD